MKRILAIIPNLIPSTYIYIIKPFIKIAEHQNIGVDIKWENEVSNTDILKTDLIVFCRNKNSRYYKNLETVIGFQKPYIYDLDDNLLGVPAHYENSEYHNDINNLELLKKYLENAFVVRVYSSKLQEIVSEYNPNTRLYDGPVDLSLIPSNPKIDKSSKQRILFSTSRMEDSLFEIFKSGIENVLKKFPKCELHLWGSFSKSLIEADNVVLHKYTARYERYIQELFSGGYTIGLAPVFDDEFHCSKTNIKFREYGACFIPGVYSDVRIYSESVEHNRTGMLTENSITGWENAVSKLIQDRSLQESIRMNARKVIEEKYSQKAFIANWLELINESIESKTVDYPSFNYSLVESQNKNVEKMLQKVKKRLNISYFQRKLDVLLQTREIKRKLNGLNK